MSSVIDWLATRWLGVAIPLVVFLAALITTFWLRRVAYDVLNRWAKKTKWRGDEILLQSTRGPSSLWCLIISAYLALAVSGAPPAWKVPIGKGLWTLFILSLTLTALNLAGRFIQFYGERFKLPQNALTVSRNIARIAIIVISILVMLDFWGVPTTPILLLIAMAVLGAALVFRDIIPNVFAGLQLSTTGQVKVGDYIKLDTGEEGYVTEISWRNTQIKGLDEGTVIVPNSKLIRSTVVNYGHPLRRAKELFHFFTRTHLKELTGLKARNLRELADTLRTASDSIIYYHTHHFLEEHHFLTPEPANDFALWVSDALGDEALGERLAAVDTFDFPTLGALKERIVSIIDEYIAQGSNLREAPEGREFHFTKSVSVIMATPYVANDLRQFVEALRKVSVGSLYFHIFESRLRLGRGLNDFSIWLEDSLEEKELAEKIAQLDPYTYTLEGLRSSLIQLMEKRIK